MKRKLVRIFVVMVVLLTAAFGLYLGNDHSGTDLSLLTNPPAGVRVQDSGKTIAFIPEEIRAGVVFYPGAKIRANAYLNLAGSLAENGYLCVLVNMPLNLAMLDSDAALTVQKDWPEVKKWFIGGHSMGGLAAEKCASAHEELFEGLIVLASRIQYTFDKLPVLAVYASNDGICSPERLAKEPTEKPENYTELMIEGGCHGYFGNYGDQFMDGTPTITREAQQEQTKNAVLHFLGRCEAEK